LKSPYLNQKTSPVHEIQHNCGSQIAFMNINNRNIWRTIWGSPFQQKSILVKRNDHILFA